MNKLYRTKLDQIAGYYCSISDKPVKSVAEDTMKQTIVVLEPPVEQFATKYQSWLKAQHSPPV